MIRGVSDLADSNKDSGYVKRWRPYACKIAAAWAIAFIRSGPVPFSQKGVASEHERSRLRLVTKIRDVYREMALTLVTGGKSSYYQQTIDKYLNTVKARSLADINESTQTCKILASDMIWLLKNVSETAESVLSQLERLRTAFGYAFNPTTSFDFDGMIDALEAFTKLAPKHPDDYRNPAQFVSETITELSKFISSVLLLDKSFVSLCEGTAPPRVEGYDVTSRDAIENAIGWFKEYYEILQVQWRHASNQNRMSS
jgi:hypothetical protein